MFRWCSYCQCHMGQSEPCHDYSLTHGICEKCKKKFYEDDNNESSLDHIQPLISFYEKLRNKAVIGSALDTLSIFSEAKSFNIKPIDLLAGMIQPLLYEIGSRYQDGTLQIYEEHIFSEFTSNLINELKREYNLTLPYNLNPEVLLFLSNKDQHVFGVRFLEIFLLQEGVSTKAILQSLPTEQIFQMAKKLSPKIIGISITDPDKYDDLINSLDIFTDWKEAPMIIIGGQGVTKREISHSFVKVHNGNLQNFLEIIRVELQRHQRKSA